MGKNKEARHLKVFAKQVKQRQEILYQLTRNITNSIEPNQYFWLEEPFETSPTSPDDMF